MIYLTFDLYLVFKKKYIFYAKYKYDGHVRTCREFIVTQ